MIAAKDGSFEGYLATPPFGAGALVIQEIFGINRWIRSVVDGFAAPGYVALAHERTLSLFKDSLV